MEVPLEHIKAKAFEIFNAAISAVNPYRIIKAQKDNLLSFYISKNLKNFYVIGFGKASFEMALAINDCLGAIITEGIVITKYGHAKGFQSIGKIKIYEAGHPIPDENGVLATKKVMELLKKADESTLVVCLISGGGSALLVSPLEPLTLAEKQITTKVLLEAGADIFELNTVRKHLSSVKGGRLALLAYPAFIKSLILSDVPKDRIDVIASGPTTFDLSTYRDALDVLRKYSILDKVPKKVVDVLERGINGEIEETLKERDAALKNVENIIVGNNKVALLAAEKKAKELGFDSEILSPNIVGEAKEVGRYLASIAMRYVKKRREKPLCLLSGGETTVKVTGKGKGGRNTELALSFAMEIEGITGILLLSAGTDGTDGPTDAAGAYVTGETVKNAKKLGLDPFKYLENNDTYNFFKSLGCLFVTGPTGTNVMDVQIMLIL